jgi:hypothetical protein
MLDRFQETHQYILFSLKPTDHSARSQNWLLSGCSSIYGVLQGRGGRAYYNKVNRQMSMKMPRGRYFCPAWFYLRACFFEMALRRGYNNVSRTLI